MNNWQTFFDHHAPEYMGNVFTRNTIAEVDFLIEVLQLSPGMAVLDMGCGAGRHSVELARRGFRMTGVDLSAGMLAEAQKAAQAANVQVEWIQADATRFQSQKSFDAAICLCEGAFGLVNLEEDAEFHDSAVLRNIAAALRPGAPFLLTALNGLRAIRENTQEDIEKARFDPLTLTETHSMEYSTPDGVKAVMVCEKTRLPHELAQLCRQAGFEVRHIWGGTAGNWGQRNVDLDEIEVMVVARKAARQAGDLPPAPGTLAVWGGEDASLLQGATQVPVVHSVSFGYADVDEWLQVARGNKPGHIYSRNTNPTVEAFEEKLRRLEGAEAATSFSTGMAAISSLLFTFLSPGDRVVSIKDSYGGTSKLFLEFLPRFNIQVSLNPTGDHETIEADIARGCTLLYLETPTNPTLKIVDIARLADAAHQNGALVVVDNTFATPLNQNPLQLGADLVVHSATKFLGGHADALGGILCGGRRLIEQVYHFREINGATLHPMSAYLLLRGMKTLHLRIRQQNESALQIARFLQLHPKVETVFYPGLETHEAHTIARRQMRGFGGVLSFTLKGGYEAVRGFLPRLQFAHRAANLGAVETVAGPPATTSHVECTPEERAALGIPEGLVRYSVGIEETQDLIADLTQALAAV
jgi:cystathionine gamma-synthase